MEDVPTARMNPVKIATRKIKIRRLVFVTCRRKLFIQ